MIHVKRSIYVNNISRCYGASIDFEKRPYVPDSGWPISEKDMHNSVAKAHEYLDLGPLSYSARESFPAKEQLPDDSDSSDVTLDGIWRFSLPTNTWAKYRDFLKSSPKVEVLINASCTGIIPSESGNHVESLKITSSPNCSFTVHAKNYVLCMGALEITRLLLAANSIQKQGIGNDHGLVGRFYISHLNGNAGTIEFKTQFANYFWRYVQVDDVYCQRVLRLTHEAQRREGLLNMAVSATHMDFHDPTHGSGILSSIYLAKRYFIGRIPPEFSPELSSAKYEHLLHHLKNVATSPMEMAYFAQFWTRKRILSRRKVPSAKLRSPAGTYTIHFDGEQSPNWESRVYLATEKDAFGLPRLIVDWKMKLSDAESLARSLEIMGRDLKSRGIATLKLKENLAEYTYANNGVGSHHIGITRMGATPSAGVVDAQCRVFGMPNLYIASSSVFPTAGYANPTLEITAIAVRIAAHIADNA